MEMNYPIAIIAANRFNYFKKVVDALVPQFDKRPVVLFLDRDINGNVDEQHVDYIKSKNIYNLQTLVRETHYGCGKNIIDARRWMFEKFADQSAIHVFEDDMVPSSSYIKKNEQLFKYQTGLHYNVGATQLWSECKLPYEEKEQRKDAVRATFENLWGYLISRRCWNNIFPFLRTYAESFLNRSADYRMRPHNEIWGWILHQHIAQPRFIFQLSYVLNKEEEEERIKYMSQFITGQDAVTIHAMHILGWVRIATVVNRGIYIGESGVHKTPAVFKQMGYDKIEMFED